MIFFLDSLGRIVKGRPLVILGLKLGVVGWIGGILVACVYELYGNIFCMEIRQGCWGCLIAVVKDV